MIDAHATTEFAATLPGPQGQRSAPYMYPYANTLTPEIILAAWAIDGGGLDLIAETEACPMCSDAGYLIALHRPPLFTVTCPLCKGGR